jgi:hypothetical protein
MRAATDRTGMYQLRAPEPGSWPSPAGGPDQPVPIDLVLRCKLRQCVASPLPLPRHGEDAPPRISAIPGALVGLAPLLALLAARWARAKRRTMPLAPARPFA